MCRRIRFAIAALILGATGCATAPELPEPPITHPASPLAEEAPMPPPSLLSAEPLSAGRPQPTSAPTRPAPASAPAHGGHGMHHK